MLNLRRSMYGVCSGVGRLTLQAPEIGIQDLGSSQLTIMTVHGSQSTRVYIIDQSFSVSICIIEAALYWRSSVCACRVHG